MRNEGVCRGPVPGLGADMAAVVPLLTGAKASRNLPVCIFISVLTSRVEDCKSTQGQQEMMQRVNQLKLGAILPERFDKEAI